MIKCRLWYKIINPAGSCSGGQCLQHNSCFNEISSHNSEQRRARRCRPEPTNHNTWYELIQIIVFVTRHSGSKKTRVHRPDNFSKKLGDCQLYPVDAERVIKCYQNGTQYVIIIIYKGHWFSQWLCISLFADQFKSHTKCLMKEVMPRSMRLRSSWTRESRRGRQSI